MNERYLFRGKRKDNDEWIEGYLIQGNKTYIATTGAINYMVVSTSYMASIELVEVIPETVGQCTGLKDKNGKLIFEGDILHIKTGKGWSCPIGTDIYYKVVYTKFNIQRYAHTEYIGFMAERSNNYLSPIHYVVTTEGAEVIGNIHDNPNLLKIEHDSLCETETYKAGDEE